MERLRKPLPPPYSSLLHLTQAHSGQGLRDPELWLEWAGMSWGEVGLSTK